MSVEEARLGTAPPQAVQEWERRVAAGAHAAPLLWFIPFSPLLPLLFWSFGRKRPYIAANAREASLYWLGVAMLLYLVACLGMWGWAVTVLWLTFSAWALLATMAAFLDINRPYPAVLASAAAYWARHEPFAMAWLLQKLSAVAVRAKVTTAASNQPNAQQGENVMQPECEPSHQNNYSQPSMSTTPPAPKPKSVLRTRIPSTTTWGVAGCLIGVLLGIPISYWFQPGILRMVVSLPQYLNLVAEALPTYFSGDTRGGNSFVLAQEFQGILRTILFAVVASGAVGAVTGIVLGDRKDRSL